MERDLKKIVPYKPNKNWYSVQFNLHNPTPNNYIFDLFNGYTLSNIQDLTYTYVNPTVYVTTVSPFISPVGIGYNPNNNYMYVSDFGSNTVSVIDCSTNLIVGSPIVVGSSPREIAYNSSNNCIYVTNQSSSSVSVIDCNSNTVLVSSIPVGLNSIGIAYNSINNCMYVCSSSSSSVYVIDCATNTVTNIISLTGFNGFITFNPTNNIMYVSLQILDSVAMIDCATNTVVGSLIPVGTTPEQMAYNSFSNSIYVTNLNTNDVSIINCASNTVTSSFSVGNNPYGITYNSYTNSMYVSNSGDTYISIIDCSSNTTTGTLSVGTTPRGLFFNPSMSTIYITNSSSNDVYVYSPLVYPYFYINGSTSYNGFLRELQNTPKRVRHITMVVESGNQLTIPYEIVIRDANGNQKTNPKIPNTYTSVNQTQSFVCEIDFDPKELILNNTNIFSQYTILANSTVKMVIYYDEIDKSDMLSEIIDYAKIADIKVPDGNTKTEEEIEAKDFRPLTKPEWLKDFKVAKKITV